MHIMLKNMPIKSVSLSKFYSGSVVVVLHIKVGNKIPFNKLLAGPIKK